MSTAEPSIKKARTDETAATPTEKMGDSSPLNRSDIMKEANEALKESNKLHVRPIVDEKKLGIECFVGDRKDEFHGLIKTRYADFIVHEVDLDGNIAYLTKLEAPDDTSSTKTVELSELLDSKSLECMAEVNSGYLNRHMIDVTGMDKNARTSLHHSIKATFDRLESCTLTESELAKQDKKDEETTDKEVEKKIESDQQVTNEKAPKADEVVTTDISREEKRYVVVTRRNKISRPKNVWPRDRPDHTHFILYKENKDTMDAVHNLAAAINARPSNFSFAGTKDRRAVTSQWLSSWRLEPRKLIAACRRFNKRPFIKVGNFCFKREPIRLGQLKSNKFDIVIRHLVYNHEGAKVVAKAMESIKQNGFVNYFGLQRFGTRSIKTHQVGLAILRESWDEAIDLILSYRSDDNMHPPKVCANNESSNDIEDNDSNVIMESNLRKDPQKQEGKRWSSGAEQHNSFIDLWKSKLDAEVVFKKYPHYRFSNEGLIMKSLSKSDDASKSHLNTLTSLPRTTRSMYVHSYQSLIWNKIVTFRLKEFGFEVVPGDLILTSDSDILDNSLEVLLTTDEVESTDDPQISNNNNNLSATRNDDGAKKTNIEEIESRIVLATEENCKDYSIFDVVLPIIGSRVRLPANSVCQEIDRLLKEDGLSLDSFKTHEKVFISYGSYRKIMVKPNNVAWSLRQYSHPHQNLVETDLDRLNKASEDKPISPAKSDSDDEALVVELELPSSSYATMCLREIMKKPSTDSKVG